MSDHGEVVYWMCAYAQAVQEAKEEGARLAIKIAALEKEIDRLKNVSNNMVVVPPAPGYDFLND